MGWFNRGTKDKSGAAAATAVDPVCKMDVDTSKPAATSSYQGKTYYFCALGCKKAFDANPSKYLGGGAAPQAHGQHGGGCCGH